MIELSANQGIFSYADYTAGDTLAFDVALNAAFAACVAKGGGIVKLPPSLTGYTTSAISQIQVPNKVTFDCNNQLVTWTANTTSLEDYCIRVMPGGAIKDWKTRHTGTGPGTSIFLRSETAGGADVFDRDLKTTVSNGVGKGNTGRTNNGIYLLADGDNNYIQSVTIDNVNLTEFQTPYIMEAKTGTTTCFVNANTFSRIYMDKCIRGPILRTDSATADVNNNHFVDQFFQATPSTTDVGTFDRASSNFFDRYNVYDWDEPAQDTGITFINGAINNVLDVRCSAAKPGAFFGGANVDDNTATLIGRLPSSERGTITVRSPLGVSVWNCRADGTNDDRDTVVEAMNFAVANMPAHVKFGPGNYGMSGGMILRPPPGADGLTVESDGNTWFVFTGGQPLTGGQEIMFKVDLLVSPTEGDYANYIKNVTFRNLNCIDDDPVAHGTGAATDESHFIDIRYTVGALIENCHATDIGDEAFDFADVRGGVIRGCRTFGSPSVGVSGAPISVQHGCHDILVEGNFLYGSNTIGTIGTTPTAAGISVACIAARDISNVRIKNNVVRDFSSYAFFFNPSASGTIISDIDIENNTAGNCDRGFVRSGSQGSFNDVRVTRNRFSNMITHGAYSQVNATSERHTYSGNVWTSCPRGIEYITGDNIRIELDEFNGCGGTSLREIHIAAGTGNWVDGVKIRDTQASADCIRDVPDVHNCYIQRGEKGTLLTGVNDTGVMVNRGLNMTGCTLINGGFTPLSTAVGGDICDNNIYLETAGSASSTKYPLDMLAANIGFKITGNRVDTTQSSNSQVCLRTNAATTGTLIDGNVFLSGGTALADNGTSTVGTNIS